MVPIPSLWLPILLSAVFVFLVSWVIHMFLPYHRSDFRGVPSEDEVMDALRRFNIPPGEYMIPHGGGPEAMHNPAFIEKMKRGPVALITVTKPGVPDMGSNLAQWFAYCVLVSIFAGYVAGRALGPGSDYLPVFRFVGTTAFVGYALALLQNSIWQKRPWSVTMKSAFDGLIYGLVTAGTFGWLWPS
jgi:hypothetical protein